MSKYETTKSGLVKDTETGATGVFRTVGGRRIFIKEGQDLASAMKESGKFGKKEIEKPNEDNAIKNLKMKDMSKEDKKNLYEYTEGWYNQTNVALRNGENLESSKQIIDLDKAISKGYIEKETLYRTANLNELGIKINEDDIWDKCEKNHEQFTKGLKYPSSEYNNAFYKSYIQTNKEVYEEIKDKIKINNVIEDKAYKSTSKSEEIITKYQSIYIDEKIGKIPSPTQALIKYNVVSKLNAIDIGESSYIKDQKEVLIQRNTKSKITKIEYSDKYNCTYIEMDLYK